jgi:hypothetical protein
MIAHEIYPIARVVVANDPPLARKRLDLAIRQKSDLKPWLDKNGNPSLEPTQPRISRSVPRAITSPEFARR